VAPGSPHFTPQMLTKGETKLFLKHRSTLLKIKIEGIFEIKGSL